VLDWRCGNFIAMKIFFNSCRFSVLLFVKWSDDGLGAEDRFAMDARNYCLGAEYLQVAVMLQIMSIQQSKTEVALDEIRKPRRIIGWWWMGVHRMQLIQMNGRISLKMCRMVR